MRSHNKRQHRNERKSRGEQNVRGIVAGSTSHCPHPVISKQHEPKKCFQLTTFELRGCFFLTFTISRHRQVQSACDVFKVEGGASSLVALCFRPFGSVRNAIRQLSGKPDEYGFLGGIVSSPSLLLHLLAGIFLFL
jgi:hypothetical protein